MKPISLAVLASHPVQYMDPLYRALSQRLDLRVLYSTLPDAEDQGRAYGIAYEWDPPLLQGYPWQMLSDAGASSIASFWSCRNPRIANTLREIQPDAVLIQGWSRLVMVQGLFAAWQSAMPVLLRCEVRRSSQSLPSRLLAQTFLRRSSAFATIGENNRAFYQEQGISSDRLFPSPYSVGMSDIQKRLSPAASRALRSEHRILPGTIVFLFVGRLAPSKRPLDFLLALDELSRRRTSARFLGVVVGEGELSRSLRDHARLAGTPVEFLGFFNQQNLPVVFGATQVLVLPSDERETWGLVVNEAMACGLPAVVSDSVGCVPDLIQPGYTGEVYPTGNIPKLADAMELFLDDPNRSDRLGTEARRRVEQTHCVSASAQGIVEGVEYCVSESRS